MSLILNQTFYQQFSWCVLIFVMVSFICGFHFIPRQKRMLRVRVNVWSGNSAVPVIQNPTFVFQRTAENNKVIKRQTSKKEILIKTKSFLKLNYLIHIRFIILKSWVIIKVHNKTFWISKSNQILCRCLLPGLRKLIACRKIKSGFHSATPFYSYKIIVFLQQNLLF